MKKLFRKLVLASFALTAATSAAAAEWTVWGNDLTNAKHAKEETKISPKTVGKLAPKWIFDFNQYNDCEKANCGTIATPTIHGNTLFIPDSAGNLYALNKETGKAKWVKKIKDYSGVEGDYSRSSPAVGKGMIYVGSRMTPTMFGVDAKDGSLKWKSELLDDHMVAMITGSPIVKGNRVYVGISSFEVGMGGDPSYPCCSFRGSVVALDAKTGKVVWKTYMAPPPPGKPDEWFSGNAVWGSSFSVDEKRNSLYIATGQNYNTPEALKACLRKAGEDKKAVGECMDKHDHPQNFVDAIVSLNLDSGKVNWGVKLQGYDAWTIGCGFLAMPKNDACPDPEGPDFDFGQAPMVWTAEHNGKKQDFVGAGQKSGIFWALDRDTGKVLWNTYTGDGPQGPEGTIAGGILGGSQFGSSTDGERIYTNETYGEDTNGIFVALDAGSGKILWNTSAPGKENFIQGSTAVANGVVFGGGMAAEGPNMFALDAKSGKILWSYASGGSVSSHPSIVDGVVYWGSGYNNFGVYGVGNHLFHAFEIKK